TTRTRRATQRTRPQASRSSRTGKQLIFFCIVVLASLNNAVTWCSQTLNMCLRLCSSRSPPRSSDIPRLLGFRVLTTDGTRSLSFGTFLEHDETFLDYFSWRSSRLGDSEQH